MKPSVSANYVESLFVAREYQGLVWLSSLICGSEAFEPQDPAYGLEPPLFLFVETLAWSAQAIRSGVWTYFEATPIERQQRMLAHLKTMGPLELGERYESAMRVWRNPASVAAIDEWIAENEQQNNDFLWTLAAQNRLLINQLFR
jgi:hypothetical protein